MTIPARASLLDSTVAQFTPKIVKSKPKGDTRRAVWAAVKRNKAVIRTGVFATVGFGAPCVAAFEWQSWAGWVAVGVAALLWDKAVNDVRPE